MEGLSMKYFSFFSAATLAILMLTSCVHTTRVNSSLQGSEFNDIAHRYMQQPTTITLVGDVGNIRISYETYDSTIREQYFSKKYVNDYLKLIDKYLAWEKLATSSGDQFQKIIGSAPDTVLGTVTFSFYSGNAHSHYLIIEGMGKYQKDGQSIENVDLYFDKTNVLKLRQLFNDLRDGKVEHLDVDAKYK